MILLSAPGFLRRLAAQLYDLLLLIALLFFATALLLPFTAGEAFTAQQYLDLPRLPAGRQLLFLRLVLDAWRTNIGSACVENKSSDT